MSSPSSGKWMSSCVVVYVSFSVLWTNGRRQSAAPDGRKYDVVFCLSPFSVLPIYERARLRESFSPELRLKTESKQLHLSPAGLSGRCVLSFSHTEGFDQLFLRHQN